jgi:hypothetical protein
VQVKLGPAHCVSKKIKRKESATKIHIHVIYVLFVQKEKYFLKGEIETMA